MNKYFMVFDVGTGAGRVVIFDDKGKLIGKSYKEWSYESDEVGLQFKAEKFWQIFQQCVQEVLADKDINPRNIVAITSTAQREGIVLLDKEGNSLYAGPNLDARGDKYNRQLAKKYGEKIYFKTGHWPEYLFAPGRLNWIKENKSEIYGRIDSMLLLNDWILYKLTGKMYAEPSNASEVLLYNLIDKCWDKELIDLMNISRNILPPVLENGARVGKLSKHLAREWGLNIDTPVVVGGADTQSALVGCGLIKEGELGIVAGSTCPSQVITDKPVIDKKMRTWTNAFILKDKYVIEANTRPTGLLFRWVRDSFYSHLESKEAFAQMEREAQAVPPGSKGVMSFMGPLISDVSCEGINHIRQISGLPVDFFSKEGRGVLVRSVLENVAFATKGNIDLLEEITGKKPERIVITGGNTNNKLLLTILASLLEVPLEVALNVETTSLGGAITAAVGSGYYQNWQEAVANMASDAKIVKGSSDFNINYRDFYKKWLKKYKKIKGDIK